MKFMLTRVDENKVEPVQKPLRLTVFMVITYRILLEVFNLKGLF